MWTYYLVNSRAWLVYSPVMICKSRHHSVKFWELVASGNNIRCCWHCVVKASLPLHSGPIVWFSSHQQSTTESGPSLSVKTYHQSMCYWLSNCSILYIYAANYSKLTSSLVQNVSTVSSLTWQECGFLCARLRGTDGEWQGRELLRKIGLLFRSSCSQPQTFRGPIKCSLKFVLLIKNKIHYRIWQNKELVHVCSKKYGGV